MRDRVKDLAEVLFDVFASKLETLPFRKGLDALLNSSDEVDWLDGLEGSDASAPGALRGDCTYPAASDSSAAVVFSNIKIGDLGSTFLESSSSTAVHYGQWCVFSDEANESLGM